MIRFLGTTLLLICLSAAGTAQADIFRLEDDDGVVSFTDSPSSRGYTLVMRDRAAHHPAGKKSRPRSAAGAVNSTTNSRSGTDSRQQSGTLPLQGIITSTAGLRFDPFDGKLRHHNGIDIAAPTGTPVKPVAPGTVVFSGQRSGYGNTVIIDHNDGMKTIYAHHAENLVPEGAEVDCATVIALSGSTGRSTGPHLHFEAWQDDTNISRSFMPAHASNRVEPALASAPVRRLLQPDGTILFTNLR